MNPVLWGGVVVILLVLVAAITMGKTKWGRSELDQSPVGRPRSHGRVSGEDD